MKTSSTETHGQREPKRTGPKHLPTSARDLASQTSSPRIKRIAFSVLSTFLISIGTCPASNIWLTGHDVLYHTGQNGNDAVELNYLRTRCKSSPIPANNYTIAVLGSGVGTWGPSIYPALLGYSALNVTYFQMPLSAATWANLTTGPLSKNLLMINSHTSCSGCDVSDAGVTEINAHAAQIRAALNGGMDLYVESGAKNLNYYNFLPPGFAVAGSSISGKSGFLATPAGVAAGLSPNMLNGFETHNRFNGYS